MCYIIPTGPYVPDPFDPMKPWRRRPYQYLDVSDYLRGRIEELERRNRELHAENEELRRRLNMLAPHVKPGETGLLPLPEGW